MRPVGVAKKRKKGQKLSCVKLAICPDHPRRHRPLKFCMRGRVHEVVIYFKFHENRSRGLGAMGGRKSPSPIDKAHGYRTSRDGRLQPEVVIYYHLRHLAGPCKEQFYSFRAWQIRGQCQCQSEIISVALTAKLSRRPSTVCMNWLHTGSADNVTISCKYCCR